MSVNPDIPISVHMQVWKDNTKSFSVTLTRNDVIEFLLGMSLLMYGKSDHLSLGKPSEVTLNFKLQESDHHCFFDGKPPSFEIRLAKNACEYITSFYLDLYQNGTTPVQHIDIDLYEKDTANSTSTLTLQSASFEPPMTADEARKIIDSHE